jgi:hypothetical protein
MSSVAYQSQTQVQPHPGEGYEQFVYRAHTELLPQVPDPNTRNAVVWGAWEQANGDPLRDRAEEYFPPDQYRTVPNVCYFREHETKSRDGSLLKYDFEKLAELCRNNNDRADTDSYSVIASHHTPHDDDERKKPKTIGFAGPYRMGMIGRQKPVWAIFADEHHLKTEQRTFAERPRRSVEVLRFRDGRPSYFDPIATLGVDSPRLNMPVARYEHDAEVERYSVMAPVGVGQSNTFIPSAAKSKDQYGSQPNPQGEQMQMGDLSEQSVNQIVQAIMALPPIQWAIEQMDKPAGQPGSDAVGDMNTPNDPVSPDDLGLPSGGDMGGQMPPASPMASPAPPSPVDQSAPSKFSTMQPYSSHAPAQQPYPQHYSENEEDMDREQYSAMQETISELQEGYNALLEQNKQLIKDHYSARDAIVNLEKDRVNASRRLRISELANKYEGFVEADELLDKCLYSEKANMSEADFESHIGLVEKYAAKAANVVPTGMVPNGVLRGAGSETIEQKLQQAVIDRYTVEANNRQIRDPKVIEAEIRKEWGLAE